MKRRRSWSWLWLALAAGAGVMIPGLQRPGAAQLGPARQGLGPRPAQAREYDAAVAAAYQHPKDATLALEAGGIIGDLGYHETALRWFRRASALNPKLLPAITGQGQMWLELGWPGRAAAAFERALRLAPEEPQLLVEIARAYTSLRDLDRALAYAKRAEQKAPSDAGVCRALATVYMERQETEPSIQCTLRACKLAPDDPKNWLVRGQVLLRDNRYSEAESALRRALRLDPGGVSANTLLGRTLTAARKTPPVDREAFALLARARLQAPQDPLLLLLQGEIALRARQFPLAVSLLRQAREAAPTDPAVLRTLGQALTRAGKMEEGIRLGAASQKLGPRGMTFSDVENTAKRVPDPPNTAALADLYRRQELYDSAIWALERGLRRTPGHPGLMSRLAAVRAEAKERLPKGL